MNPGEDPVAVECPRCKEAMVWPRGEPVTEPCDVCQSYLRAYRDGYLAEQRRTRERGADHCREMASAAHDVHSDERTVQTWLRAAKAVRDLPDEEPPP